MICGNPDVQLCLHIHQQESRGDTPDEEVNGWHRDFVELSAQKIMSLAGLIRESGLIGGIQEKRITTLIAQGITAQRNDLEKVSQGILAKVGRLLRQD